MRVEPKTVVGIEFTMKDANGTILESSEGKGPLEYLHGVGMPIPPGLIQAVEGMCVGESKSVTIAPDLAFGEVDQGLVVKIDRAAFGQNQVEIGMRFHADLDQYLPDKRGYGPRQYAVKEISAENVTMDGNFELAGKTLHFDIKVVSVRAAELTELAHGHPHQSGGCCGGGGCGSGEASSEGGCCSTAEASEGGCCSSEEGATAGGCCSTEQPVAQKQGGCGSAGCGCSA